MAALEGVIGPDTLDLLDVTLFESHLTLAVQFVVFNHTIVSDARVPSDLELAIHCLVLEGSFIDGWPLLILALVPGDILECPLEPALTSSLQVLNLALQHVTCLEETLINRLSVREVQSALTMPLIHLIDLAIVSGTIAVADVLHG